MKAVLKTAAIGVGLLALSGGAERALAATVNLTNGQTISGLSTGNTYVYGDTTFTFLVCGSCANWALYGVTNGRGGTEIEIENKNTSSSILSTSTATVTASFTLKVGLNTGSHGISKITDILSGSGSPGSAVTSVLSNFSFTGQSATAGGQMTSTLAANSQVTTLSTLLNSGSSFTFTDTLTADGTKSGGTTLKLSNIALLFNPAPEPASIAILSTGLFGVGIARRRFRRNATR